MNHLASECNHQWENIFFNPSVALVISIPYKNPRSEEHTSELQSQSNLVCRLLLEKKKKKAKHSWRANNNSPFTRNFYPSLCVTSRISNKLLNEACLTMRAETDSMYLLSEHRAGRV